MEKTEKDSKKFMTYRDKPLVRCGDVLYYGDMAEKYVIKMEIKSKRKIQDLEVADKVLIQLMYTDPAIRSRKQIIKVSEKDGLFNAIDIADAWLTRALTQG
jgi:hypothetical protein